MMKRYLYTVLLAVAALLAASACQRVEPQMPEEEGQLVLTFGNPQTKATGAELADGSAFRDLIVLLCENGTILQRVDKQETDFVKSDKVVFNGLELGIYDVYAFANTTDPAWLAAGFSFDSYTENSTIDEDQILKVLAGSAAPAAPTTDKGMLLIGQKTFEVGVGSNEASIPLIRPVASFNVQINNHTENKVTVKSLSFSNFNPSHSYLFDHDMNLPAGNTYRQLPAFAGNLEIAAGASTTAYSTLLYENVAPEYKLSTSIEMATSIEVPKKLSVDDLNAMEVGKVKLIVMVNPHKNAGYFLGCGTDGSKISESCVGLDQVGLSLKAKELATSDSRYWMYLEKIGENKFTIRSYTAGQYGTEGSRFMAADGNRYMIWGDYSSNPETFFATSYGLRTTDLIGGIDNASVVRIGRVSNGSYYLSSNGAVTDARFRNDSYEYTAWFLYETDKVVTKGTETVKGYQCTPVYNISTDGTQYVIRFGTDGNYLRENGSGQLRANNTTAVTNGSPVDSKALWVFEAASNGRYYLKNVSSGKYIYYNNSSTPGYGSGNNTELASWSQDGLFAIFTPNNYWTTHYCLTYNSGNSPVFATAASASGYNNYFKWQISAYTEPDLPIPSYTTTQDTWGDAIIAPATTATLTDAQINRIDNETGKVSKLEWMKRNEKINVIINIYYNDKEAVFEYYVDNSNWITPTTSEHQFK